MGRPVQDLATRFWDKVEQGPPEDCWPWTGTHHPQGYGTIWIGGKGGRPIDAKKVAFMLANRKNAMGPVRLTCGTKDCCNPNHMEG